MKLLGKNVVAISLIAMTMACGGGGGDSTPQPGGPNPPADPNPAPPGNQPPPLSSEPYRVEYHGDSTVWGWRSLSAGAQVATPPPVAFASYLPAPAQSRVSNEGVSGTTACDLLEGTAGVSQPWQERMRTSDATHVILNHAINDRKSLTTTRYRNCLSQIVVVARQHGKEVVFETPNPITTEGLAAYVDAMRSVAAQQSPAVPVIDQYAFLRQCLGTDDVVRYVPDGEHPSDEVYIAKGRYAASVFAGLYPRQGLTAPPAPACP